jgi:hypothetical protein
MRLGDQFRLRRLAVRANSGNFDDRCLRNEACRTRSAFDRIGDRGRCGFADRTALFADQEYHRIAAVVIVHAGNEGVAAFDSMHQILLAQEIERSINRDRGRPRAAPRQTVDKFVGSERMMACQQRLEHAPAHRRQALFAGGADRLGVGDRVVRATPMVVIGLGKYRLRG